MIKRTHRRWRDLSARTRTLVIIGAVTEGVLKTAALTDLARRPADAVHGPKWRWVTAITLINSGGAAPLAYFAFGRRR